MVILVLEILLLSKTANFPFRTMGYSPWSSKNLTVWNRLKKFMQVGIDVTCMHTDFGGRGFSGFRDTATLKNGQFSLSNHGLYSPLSSKNLIVWNRLKKFMQVGVNVTCMHTNFWWVWCLQSLITRCICIITQITQYLYPPVSSDSCVWLSEESLCSSEQDTLWHGREDC